MANYMFPSKSELASELRRLDTYGTPEGSDESVDVRLQVTPAWWSVHVGDASYDQDHRGIWGASCLPGEGSPTVDYDQLADDLIEQCREMQVDSDAAERA